MASYPVRDIEELHNVLQAMDKINKLIRMMVEFEARTGLRYVDISRLKFSDVMINGVIKSSFSVVQSKGYNARISKAILTSTNRMREITGDNTYQLTDTEIEAAKKAADKYAKEASRVTIHVNSGLAELIHKIYVVNGHNRLLFQSNHHQASEGKTISIQYINKVYRRVAAELGLPYQLTTHSMRKTFAMLLLNGGASIKVVKDALGHSSIAVTDSYLRTFNDEAKEHTTGISF